MTYYSSRSWLFATPLMAILAFVMFVGPAAAQQAQEPAPEAQVAVNPQDPYENWNRKVYRFNDTIDRWALKPVAQTYRTFTPDFIDRAITNFFNNL